jgi:hypothetical protein
MVKRQVKAKVNEFKKITACSNLDFKKDEGNGWRMKST